MTNDEAIKVFQSELRWAELDTYPYISKQKVEADKMAIKLLKQESVLDKIRAEIEELDIYHDNDYFSTNNCPMYKCNEVLQIIDKYKAESEDKE